MKEIVVPLIVLLSYSFGEIYKLVLKKHEDLYNNLPIFVTLTGGLIAVILYLIDVNMFSSSSLLEVILLGLVCGSSSTGTNQIIKKAFKMNSNFTQYKEDKKHE